VSQFEVQEDMADKYRVPRPGCAEDYHDFTLRVYDLLTHAREAEYSPEAIQLLSKAGLIFIDEFERKFPGYAKDSRTV
jgi:hypothetical protein